jgi:hypothetical protein
MRFETKYDFDQLVFHIAQGREQYHEKCPTCGGTSKINISGKEEAEAE